MKEGIKNKNIFFIILTSLIFLSTNNPANAGLFDLENDSKIISSLGNTSSLDLDGYVSSQASKQKGTTKDGEDRDNYNPFSSETVFNFTTINNLLSKDNYFNIKSSDLMSGTPEQANYDTITISNPLGITTGCGTVQANLEETLTIMLDSFKKALTKLPVYFIRNYLGFPDISNPKEVFNFIFDTTTTILCNAEAGIVQLGESGVSGGMTYLSNKYKTTASENKDDASGTQLFHICGSLGADLDDIEQEKETSTNPEATEKTEAKRKEDALTGQSSKYNTCKQKYEDYKAVIEAKIKKFKVYEKKAALELKSSCEVINQNSPSIRKKTVHFNPIYVSQNQVQETIPELSSGITTARSKINSDEVKPGHREEDGQEILIDKESIRNDLKVPGKLELYRPGISNMSATVYRLGSEYANTITHCLNGFDSDQANQDSRFSFICDKIDQSISPFPMILGSSEVQNDFLKIIEKKKMFCDLTLFNSGDNQFLADTIGYVTKILGEEASSFTEPTLLEYQTAVREVIENDYCDNKLYSDVRYLEVKMKENIESFYDRNRMYSEGLIIKMPIWEKKEIFVTSSAVFDDRKVIKVCARAKEQEEYYIASIDPSITDMNEETEVSIIKVESTLISDFADKVESVSDEIVNTVLETEMLCSRTTGSGKDEKTVKEAGKTTCKVKNLSCGINWEKDTDRKDNLYKDRSNGKKGLYDSSKEYYKKHRPKEGFSKYIFEKDDIRSLKNSLKPIFRLRERASIMEIIMIEQLEVDLLKKLNNLRY
jgi:hypothetical protein